MPKFIGAIGAIFLDFFELIVIGLSIFLIVYLGLMQPHQVSGRSMVPNFQNGEYVLTDKVSFKLREPQRGEVIVFKAPPAANCPQGTGCEYIKRVIGLPGETVEIKNSHVFINGVQLQENYLPSDFVTEPGTFSQNRVINLGAAEYFAVGDNRSFSSDSREWGPITPDLIRGRAFFSYWPLESLRIIRTATYPQNPEL